MAIAAAPGIGGGMLVTRAIAHLSALARERDLGGRGDHPGALRGALPLYRSGVVSEMLGRAVVVTASDPSPERSAGASTEPPAVLPRDSAPPGALDGRARGAGLPPMLLALRSMVQRSGVLPIGAFHAGALHAPAEPSTDLSSAALTPLALMRASQSRAVERPYEASPGSAETSELVLVARTADTNGGAMAIQRIGDGIVPSAPPTSAVAGGRALAVGSGVDGRGAQAAGAKPQIDLDELVDKAWQKLMRKVAVEQERRGYTRWNWQS